MQMLPQEYMCTTTLLSCFLCVLVTVLASVRALNAVGGDDAFVIVDDDGFARIGTRFQSGSFGRLIS
jgi:hypothetical protein